MSTTNLPYQHFYLPGFVTILEGLVSVTYSIKWIQLDPNPGWTAISWIASFAMIGALLIQAGVGFCMAWIVIPTTPSSYTAATTSTNEKKAVLDRPDQTEDCIDEEVSSRDAEDPDAVPFDLVASSTNYFVAGIVCSAVGTAMQFSSTVMRLFDKDGQWALNTWSCWSAIVATACFFGSNTLTWYTLCKALKLNDARILILSARRETAMRPETDMGGSG